jgi:hypothetical protein
VIYPWCSAKAITLGTRGQISSGYMLNTLWSQTTLDPNVPSDKKLGTLWMFIWYLTPMYPLVKAKTHSKCHLKCNHNVPTNQKLGTFWMSIDM